jgi:hypothetical protein
MTAVWRRDHYFLNFFFFKFFQKVSKSFKKYDFSENVLKIEILTLGAGRVSHCQTNYIAPMLANMVSEFFFWKEHAQLTFPDDFIIE